MRHRLRTPLRASSRRRHKVDLTGLRFLGLLALAMVLGPAPQTDANVPTTPPAESPSAAPPSDDTTLPDLRRLPPVERGEPRPRQPTASPRGRAEALLERADHAAWRGDGDTARKLYEQALALVPEHPAALFGLGNLAAGSDDLTEAIHWFRRTTAADPDHRNGHFNLGVALVHQNRLDEAARAFQRVLTLDPHDPEAAPLLAQLYLHQAEQASDPRQALDKLRQAVATAPEEPRARLRLAQTLAESGRFTEAVVQFDAALDLAPSLPEAHVGRATALLLSRDFAAARDALEASLQALGASETDAVGRGLRHSLARLLASCPEASVRDGERALDIALRVFQADPTPAHGETVAMAYAELGRFDLAQHWQQRVLDALAESLGDDPVADTPPARERLTLYQANQPYRAP